MVVRNFDEKKEQAGFGVATTEENKEEKEQGYEIKIDPQLLVDNVLESVVTGVATAVVVNRVIRK